MAMNCLIVGAGFAGAICARQLAEAGHSVLVVDKRGHLGGNAFDKLDANGVLIHPYGPHIFHTKSKRIFEYLSRFTDWRFYEHRVRAMVDGRAYPIPINRTTINELYGLHLDENQVAAYFDEIRIPCNPIQTSEDAVLNSVGEDLCNKFFRNYTKKQWGLELAELSATVAARIPTRVSDDDRYFDDNYQFMPSAGYGAMFKNILDHQRIKVSLGVNYFDIRSEGKWDLTCYSGPIDAFFDYCYGSLPYRSLSFEHDHLPGVQRYQEVGTINFPNDHSYTRITEFKHLTGQLHSGTSIVREYPRSEGEPYYPIPRPENEALFKRYRARMAERKDVVFVGRLAEYRYYNMDQVVGAALKAVSELKTC